MCVRACVSVCVCVKEMRINARVKLPGPISSCGSHQNVNEVQKQV